MSDSSSEINEVEKFLEYATVIGVKKSGKKRAFRSKLILKLDSFGSEQISTLAEQSGTENFQITDRVIVSGLKFLRSGKVEVKSVFGQNQLIVGSGVVNFVGESFGYIKADNNDRVFFFGANYRDPRKRNFKRLNFVLNYKTRVTFEAVEMDKPTKKTRIQAVSVYPEKQEEPIAGFGPRHEGIVILCQSGSLCLWNQNLCKVYCPRNQSKAADQDWNRLTPGNWASFSAVSQEEKDGCKWRGTGLTLIEPNLKFVCSYHKQSGSYRPELKECLGLVLGVQSDKAKIWCEQLGQVLVLPMPGTDLKWLLDSMRPIRFNTHLLPHQQDPEIAWVAPALEPGLDNDDETLLNYLGPRLCKATLVKIDSNKRFAILESTYHGLISLEITNYYTTCNEKQFEQEMNKNKEFQVLVVSQSGANQKYKALCAKPLIKCTLNVVKYTPNKSEDSGISVKSQFVQSKSKSPMLYVDPSSSDVRPSNSKETKPMDLGENNYDNPSSSSTHSSTQYYRGMSLNPRGRGNTRRTLPVESFNSKTESELSHVVSHPISPFEPTTCSDFSVPASFSALAPSQSVGRGINRPKRFGGQFSNPRAQSYTRFQNNGSIGKSAIMNPAYPCVPTVVNSGPVAVSLAPSQRMRTPFNSTMQIPWTDPTELTSFYQTNQVAIKAKTQEGCCQTQQIAEHELFEKVVHCKRLFPLMRKNLRSLVQPMLLSKMHRYKKEMVDHQKQHQITTEEHFLSNKRDIGVQTVQMKEREIAAQIIADEEMYDVLLDDNWDLLEKLQEIKP